MKTPKFKELGPNKAKRLGLNKPHIFWSGGQDNGGWYFVDTSRWSGYVHDDDIHAACEFCIEQEKRWTPMMEDKS